MKQPKIIITGTGRTGTTVLIKLLTLLKFPTGFTPANFGSVGPSGGGLEVYCTGPNQGPLIVKAPQYWDKIPQMADWYDLRLVIMPIRDLHDSAASRAALPNGSPGSLWGATNQAEQENHNARVVYQVVRDCVALSKEILFLDFPRFVTEREYLWYYVGAVAERSVPRIRVKRAAFDRAFNAIMNPAKVKKYPK